MKWKTFSCNIWEKNGLKILHRTVLWERIDKIPDEELWRTHERRRERLVAFARRSLKNKLRSAEGARKNLRQQAKF